MNHYSILRTFYIISFDFYEYTSSSLSTWSEPGSICNMLLIVGVSTSRLSVAWCSATSTCTCLCAHFASFLGICLSSQCRLSFSSYSIIFVSFIGISSADVPGKLISCAGFFNQFFMTLSHRLCSRSLCILPKRKANILLSRLCSLEGNPHRLHKASILPLNPNTHPLNPNTHLLSLSIPLLKASLLHSPNRSLNTHHRVRIHLHKAKALSSPSPNIPLLNLSLNPNILLSTLSLNILLLSPNRSPRKKRIVTIQLLLRLKCSPRSRAIAWSGTSRWWPRSTRP